MPVSVLFRPPNAFATCSLVLSLFWPSGPADGAEPRSWVTSGYEAFARGTFAAAGDNLYVSRRGRLQMIHVWDVNRDGHIDLFFGQSHDHTNYQPVLIYPQHDGRPSAEAVIRLPTLRTGAVCVADLNNDGFNEVLTLNHEAIPSPVHESYVYWGGPEGLGAKYRTWLPTFKAFAADFDRDGLKEVVVANAGRARFDLAGACISVHWQTADGVFPLDRRDDRPVHACRAVDMADVDEDGFADLVLLGRIDPADTEDHLSLLHGGPAGLGPPVRLQVADDRVGTPRLLDIDGRTHLALLTSDSIDLYILAEARLTPVCRVAASPRPARLVWTRPTSTGTTTTTWSVAVPAASAGDGVPGPASMTSRSNRSTSTLRM